MHHLITLSREFRNNPTFAENLLWQEIRRRQISGFKFRRQYVIDRYIVDFVCLSERLIIQVDGDIHKENVENDKIRTDFLCNRGYRVIRFWNHDIFQNIDGIKQEILKHLEAAR